MGIKNLLPQLESITRDCHLKDFAGQRAAVDAYVWIHRGILAVTTELALGRPTTAYVDYVVKQVDSFAACGVSPILVFDGGSLEVKSAVERDRQRTSDLTRTIRTRLP